MNRLIGFAVYTAFLLGGVVVFIAAMSFELSDNFIIVFAAIIAMNFIATFFHEMGHAWMARKRGAEVDLMAVYPVGYSPKRRKFQIVNEIPSGDLAGCVSYSFPEDCETRRDEMAIAAAGPISDFLLAGLLVLAIIAWPDTSGGLWPVQEPAPMTAIVEGSPPHTDRPAIALPSDEELAVVVEGIKTERRERDLKEFGAALMRLLIVISVVSGVLNLIPFKGSDGAKILEHWLWR